MPRPSIFAIFLILPVLGGTTGCTATRETIRTAVPSLYRGDGGVVFVADGVGGYNATTDALEEAVTAMRLPLRVQIIYWSHGYGRVIADQVDYPRGVAAGHVLARAVAATLQARPDAKVYLLAHSAGSEVVLTAAANLPPNSVERIVLLSPAVSTCYDLRGALRGSRQGIDAFISERDVFVLGAAVSVLGTTDREWTAAAGRVGFTPIVATPEDGCLYRKLRHHPWTPAVLWTGNRGGHYDTYRNPLYLRYFVLPLLLDCSPG